MSIDRFISHNRFAVVLVAAHSMLVAAYAWIELNHAWNDMNPTMLVMAGLHLADYPLHVPLSLAINAQSVGTYLASLLVVGGVYWFAIGTTITWIWRYARRWFGSWHSARLAA
ncbi:MAG: hypothetical protein U0805_07885 [Pirellulales bacterium]